MGDIDGWKLWRRSGAMVLSNQLMTAFISKVGGPIVRALVDTEQGWGNP
jgi:hypothetical protein